MLLSELKTGERGVIVKVLGHGGFRKRIVEMGFIKGKLVTAVQNAPLNDPVKYQVMNYQVLLRRQEAELIEVVKVEELLDYITQTSGSPLPQLPNISEDELKKIALEKQRTINVALVGNPNAGKTSFFNAVSGEHAHVGNYSGVTVDAKEGHFSFRNYDFKLVDLPGTYSLSAYTPEELYVRQHIVQEKPDVVINIVDASNLERNLYLTTQLIDMNLCMVVALNMYDELEASGDTLDNILLSQLLGTPIIPVVSKKKWGVENLLQMVINLYEGIENSNAEEPENFVSRHIHINHGTTIETAIDTVKAAIAENEEIRTQFSTRFLAIKLLEKDADIEKIVTKLPNGNQILEIRDKEAKFIHEELREDSEVAVINAKYGFIDGALKETFTRNNIPRTDYTKIIDRIVLHKKWGYPIFVLILFCMFSFTFLLGEYPSLLIKWLLAQLNTSLQNAMETGVLKDLLTDGIINGVGSVLVFLPHIIILYLFISFLEDSGYMARGAFIMDKIMHKIGLHGKSFIPLIMGFGCTVPSVMSTRIIESHRSRLITILINPFMTCSARMQVYIMLIGTLFARTTETLTFGEKVQNSLVLVSIYFLGILLAAITAKLLGKFLIKGEDLPFVMELPPYRTPTVKTMGRHTWEKSKQFLKSMGTIILVASIVIWCLNSFPNYNPHKPRKTETEQERQVLQKQQENSYLGQIGHFIEPVVKPLGFDWKMGIGVVAGVGAKEIINSTLSIVYYGIDTDKAEEIPPLPIPPFNAFVYMLFILIYFPCIGTLAAIKRETGHWKYALFSAGYTTLLAWTLCFIVYQIGTLLSNLL